MEMQKQHPAEDSTIFHFHSILCESNGIFLKEDSLESRGSSKMFKEKN